MSLLLRRPGYRLYPPDSPEAGALLARQGLGTDDLERALVRLEKAEGVRIRTIVGINEDGVFGTTGTGSGPFIPLLWLRVHELLGRVPEGSTARFLKDGSLPD